MVNSQLNSFILVGIEISMVVMLKKLLMLLFEFMVKKWCSYMVKLRKVIVVLVQIIDLQLNMCLLVKVVVILEKILKVGRIRMYILGWFQVQKRLMYIMVLLLSLLVKKCMFRQWLSDSRFSVVVRIGNEVMIRMLVKVQVQVKIGICISFMFGVCILNMVIRKLIFVSNVFILDICSVQMQQFIFILGLQVSFDSGGQVIQLVWVNLFRFSDMLISMVLIMSSQKFSELRKGNVMLCVLICSGMVRFIRLVMNGMVMKMIMIMLCVVKIWLQCFGGRQLWLVFLVRVSWLCIMIVLVKLWISMIRVMMMYIMLIFLWLIEVSYLVYRQVYLWQQVIVLIMLRFSRVMMVSVIMMMGLW